MAAPKGHPKYGGRKKGTPNKKAIPLAEKAEALGIDPFEVLLHFAKGDWKALGYASQTEIRIGKGGECYEIDRITTDHRLKAASEACQYLHPKRKAIEVKDTRDLSEDPCEEYSDEELDDM